MDLLTFEDRLELLGALTGLFVVIAALGSLASQPWSTAESSTVAVIQGLGIVVAFALGVLVVFVTRSEEIADVL